MFPSPSDWPKDNVRATGYWIVDREECDYKPDPELESFVKVKGQPGPIYMGFGSFPVRDAKVPQSSAQHL